MLIEHNYHLEFVLSAENNVECKNKRAIFALVCRFIMSEDAYALHTLSFP